MVRKYRIEDYEEGLSFPFNIQLDISVKTEFPEHTHDHTELVLILKGSATHMVNGRPYFVQAGDVFVFSPHVRHGFRQALGLEMVNIMFRPEILSGLHSDIKGFSGFQTLFVVAPSSREDFPCRLRLTPKALAFAAGLTTRIIGEFEKKAEGYRSLCRALFCEFVIFLVRQYGREGAEIEAPAATLRLAETVAWMEKNYLGQAGLEEIAKLSGFSRRHFIRLFKEHYQTTPLRYILDLRIRHSQALLNHTDRRITQIAFDSGFTDSNYFSRQFRRSVGHSPAEFRRRTAGNP